ncbi:hypothetical protein C1701_10785 [Actinoalloteichus sp. AHMU CJ021]|uniref:hypothetical protein n=1 Tax=Actinoalloteichus TaxID=65496 RepID=UPI00047D9DC4|nr:hypothetical protein [Actinoalloteichus caeruleus]AUS78769.1 hypothetical protein C1701_10785 [Actinoalloteichus sp. AHMU CJ021]
MPVSRTPGHATGPHSDVLPTRPRPEVDLADPPESLSEAVVSVLGWRGVALPAMTLLGRRVVPVAELVPEAHAERLCLGFGPNTDRTSVATWTWPEMAGRVPPPAVRLSGVISFARHWRTALGSAAPFARHCGAAMVLPAAVHGIDDYLDNAPGRARRHGVSVLTADEHTLRIDQTAWADTVSPGGSVTGRWLRELVYERLIAHMVRDVADRRGCLAD